MQLGPDFLKAIATFAPGGSEPEAIGARSHLVKVDGPAGPVRVRRWPAETTTQRAAFVAAVRAASAPAISPAPVAAQSGDLTFELNGAIYDAQTWRDGRNPLRKQEPLDLHDRAVHAPAKMTEAGLTELAAALAQQHLATSGLIEPSAPAAALKTVFSAVSRQFADDHAILRRLALQQVVLQRWIRACEQALPAAETGLTAADFLSGAPPVVAYLNIWPAHCLFSRENGAERLTTLLDPTAAAVSSPLIDIAQAITHGSGWTTAAAEAGLAAYGDVRRLTPDERRLLPAVAALDLVAESGRLFRIAFSSGHDVDWELVDHARTGAGAALVSLETLIPAIRRATETGPLFKARPWVHRAKPTAPKSGSRSPRAGKPKP